jgi:drug/metabolite transporter superfamily protein YnfA
MVLTKKNVFILISIIYAGILSLSYFVLPIDDYRYTLWIAVLVLLALVNYLLIGIYEYNDYLKSKLVFISLIVLFGYFLLGFFPTLGNYSRAAYILGTSIGLYMLLLSANVYIVSEKREGSIPLLQPAKVIAYLAFVMSVFLASTIIYKLEWFTGYPVYNLAGKFLLFGIFYALLFKYTSWVFISEGGVGGEAFNAEDEQLLRRLQIFAVVCLTEFSLVLTFFPFEAFGRALILGGVVYYINSFIQNYIAHKVNLKFTIEIIAALTLIYTLVYFT